MKKLTKVVSSIHTLKKEAKKGRDDNDGHEIELNYALADAAFEKVVSRMGIAPVGTHFFPNDGFFRRYYEVLGFGFHRERMSEKDVSLPFLGRIEKKITATKKEGSPEIGEAKEIIKKFIGEKKYREIFLTVDRRYFGQN